jgi:hypothetical protein
LPDYTIGHDWKRELVPVSGIGEEQQMIERHADVSETRTKLELSSLMRSADHTYRIFEAQVPALNQHTTSSF